MKKLCAVLIAVLLICSAGAWAQGTTSRITGTVTDPSGASVPGATVTITNEGTGVSFSTTTSAAGAYVFDSVQIGVYAVKVEAQGFRTFVSTGNRLFINEPLTVRAALQIGDVNATVEVTDTAERVQTSTSGNFGNLVDNRSLTDLPLVGTRGRNPLEFTTFQPGVVAGANTGGGIHVHGARDRSWNFTLDGVDINESSAGGSNFTPLRPNPDSIAEFSVLTGQFTAEYGRSSGGQVALVTKSGGNEFHGQAFYFYRTPGLNANEWSNNRTGVGKAQFVQHIPGFSLGGPIWKNKTFFFSNLQFLRAHTSGLITSTVYTQQARTGNFRYIASGSTLCPGQSTARNSSTCVDSSGNPLPGLTIGTYDVAANDPLGASGGLDPSIQTFIGLTPLPNDFTVGDGLNTAGYSFLAPGGEEQYDWVMKVDHVINAKNTVYARWAQGSQTTLGDRVNGGAQKFPTTPRVVDTTRLPRNLAVNWRSNPVSHITNEFVFGWNKFTFNFVNPDSNFASNPPFDLNTVTEPIFNYRGNLRTINTYQWVDNFTYQHGAHTFRGGINFRYQSHKDVRGSVGGSNVQLSVDFSTSINTVSSSTFNLPTNINTNDLATLRATINNLLGRVGNLRQGFVANADGSVFAPGGTPFVFDARYPEYDFYVQDSWKLAKNLTLDLGLRWELKLAPTAATGRILVPDQPVFAGATPSNTLTWEQGKLYNSDKNNLAPIIGLAWDPFGDGKTSVRANYRMAYDRFNTFIFSSSVYQSLPGQAIGVVDTTFGSGGGRLRDGLPTVAPAITPSAGLQPALFSTAGQTVVDKRSLEAPQTNMWGLSIQRDLGRGFVFEANYIGRHGTNLFGAYDVNTANINAATAGTCAGETFLQAFNTVAGGGTSCLMDALFVGDPAATAVGGSQFVRNTFGTTLNQGSVGSLAAAVGRRTVGGQQMIVLSGFSPFFFQPFPQFSGILRVLDSNDFSFYHALELQIARRFRDGLGFQVSYTWAKSLDNRSFDPTFSVVSGGTLQSASSTPWDNFNRSLNKARSDFDRRHSLQSYWVYELPFGRGKRWGSGVHGALERVIGGWALNGVLIWQSGRPFTVYSGTFTFTNVVSSPANCSGCRPSDGRVFSDPNNSNQVFFFDSTEKARFSNPAPGTLGNTGRNFFNTASRFNLDLGIGKRTRITESQVLEFRLEMQNATNTPKWDENPTAAITFSTFGRLLQPGAASRKMQLVFKYHF
ncbi:MAG: carboxypeptidase regulatory-like domain-containing protein [Acidobacteria bacterium]|nr:carboxypeptidase regulatory-like domain-containing protein [Acidobacteriota bacterium]MCL5288795.1 carboxypeptidase regulatory-like domain-containing protein [Acidobacteriota bacterium]